MLFATSLVLQTVPFDININPNEKEGGWGGAERAHVDLNQLKTFFSKFQFLQKLPRFVPLSAVDFSIKNSDHGAEHWL